MAEGTQVTGRLFRTPFRTMEGDVSEEGVGSYYWMDTDALSREEARIYGAANDELGLEDGSLLTPPTHLTRTL